MDQIHFQSEHIKMWTFRLDVSKREDNDLDVSSDYKGDDNPEPWLSLGPFLLSLWLQGESSS